MIKGDINMDGLVTEEDRILLQKMILGMYRASREQIEAADMDNSGGKPTMNDLLALERLLQTRIPGDANGDGKLNDADVTVMQKEIAEILKLDKRCFQNADINADGKVNMLDVIMLQRVLAGIIDMGGRRNKITIPLNRFEKGEYLSWFVTTQAAYEVTVTLKDDRKTYFSKKKKSLSITPPLAVGSDEYIGDNLVLEVFIPESKEIRALPTTNTITADTGKVVAHTFTCCGEDWIDNDFNDFYINLVGWKSKK